MSADNLQQLAHFAGELADAAGAAIRPHFRQPINVDAKSDASPVTIADRQSEQAMRALINQRYPVHGIFGEEFGSEREDAQFLWVLDPIDGTKAFITGVPLFGSLIGLMRDGRPVVGVIDQPISGERWLGVEGRASTLNGRPIRTRACRSLSEAVLYTTTTETYHGADRERFRALRARARLTRYSADCYAFGVLAAGFVDLVVEAGLKLYDYAALIPVIEGAGGRITDWSGMPLGRHSDGRVLAAGDPALHAEVLKILNA